MRRLSFVLIGWIMSCYYFTYNRQPLSLQALAWQLGKMASIRNEMFEERRKPKGRPPLQTESARSLQDPRSAPAADKRSRRCDWQSNNHFFHFVFWNRNSRMNANQENWSLPNVHVRPENGGSQPRVNSLAQVNWQKIFPQTPTIPYRTAQWKKWFSFDANSFLF